MRVRIRGDRSTPTTRDEPDGGGAQSQRDRAIGMVAAVEGDRVRLGTVARQARDLAHATGG